MIQKEFLNECTSTNLEAREISLPLESAFVIYTLNQTKGRGSLDREWFCPANKSLAFTFTISHKAHGLQQDPRISIIAAITISNLLTSFVENQDLLKWRWPNDIIYNNKKLAGILIEWTSDRLIIGIGLNINTDPSDFPLSIASTISSLKIEADSPKLIELVDKLSIGLYQLCTKPLDLEAFISANLHSFDNAVDNLSVTDDSGSKILLSNLKINTQTGALTGTDLNGKLIEITSIHSIVYN